MEGIFYAKAAGFIACAIAIGLSTLGAALGQGLIGKEACRNIGKYPEQSGNIRSMGIVAMGFVESCPVYGLLVVVLILTMCR